MRFQKKKRRNGAVLRWHCFFFFFPWTCNRGRKVLFFFPCFFLSPSLHALLKPKSNATRVSSWWDDREVMPRKRHLHWPSLPTPWQRRRRGPHAWAAMGWDKVDPAPSALIIPPERRREKKEEGKNGSKRGGKLREKREKPTERERGTTETIKTKKTEDIDRETERNSRGEGRKRTKGINRQGKRTLIGISTQRKRRCYHWASQSPPPQCHQEQSPAPPST